nr:U32 family peptidase [Candidatus Pantoea persica]
MRYALGSVLWYWPTERLADFYQQAANSDAEIIYLGEAVCTKRRATAWARWMEIAREQAASGKQVVLSTLALLQSPSGLNELKRYVENVEFLIEANDFGAANMAAERGMPFVAGPTLNVYNVETLQLLLQSTALHIRDRFEVEVLGYVWPSAAGAVGARLYRPRRASRQR